MPILENARHERFAQELAAGKTATEAYVLAGYKPNDGNAATLKGNQRITERVAELQGRAAEGVVLTRQWVIERLIENANRAMQAEAVKNSDGEATGEYRYDGSVANRSLELLGKELGMFVDRSENTNVNTSYVVSSDPVDSVEDWEAEHAPKH
jgi:phage terminase small subunit